MATTRGIEVAGPVVNQEGDIETVHWIVDGSYVPDSLFRTDAAYAEARKVVGLVDADQPIPRRKSDRAKFGEQQIDWLEPKAERSIGELYEVGRAIAVELRGVKEQLRRNRSPAVVSPIAFALTGIRREISAMRLNQEFGRVATQPARGLAGREASPDRAYSTQDATALEGDRYPLLKYALPNGFDLFWHMSDNEVVTMWVKNARTGERWNIQLEGWDPEAMFSYGDDQPGDYDPGAAAAPSAAHVQSAPEFDDWEESPDEQSDEYPDPDPGDVARIEAEREARADLLRNPLGGSDEQ